MFQQTVIMFDPPTRPVPDPPTRVPEYPRTRVPTTGTNMRRVGYGFEKKKPSTRARRTRLPAVPMPAAGVPGPYPPANH
jgi:hypothetical protein